jgi:nicotinamidase-related amidase
MKQPLQIETPALTLREFAPADGPKVFRMSQEGRMRTWLRSQVYRDEAPAASVLAFLISQCGHTADPRTRPLVLGIELKIRGIARLVIAGLQSEYCVRETMLGALARNFEVTLVGDGHSTYDGGGRSAPQKSAAVNAEFEGRVKLTSARGVSFP